MHGAPVTVHVTSPTSRLFSLIVRVVDIGPLMSSAKAAPADRRTPMATPDREARTRMARIEHVLSETALRTAPAQLIAGVIHLNRRVAQRFRSGGPSGSGRGSDNLRGDSVRSGNPTPAADPGHEALRPPALARETRRRRGGIDERTAVHGNRNRGRHAAKAVIDTSRGPTRRCSRRAAARSASSMIRGVVQA